MLAERAHVLDFSLHLQSGLWSGLPLPLTLPYPTPKLTFTVRVPGSLRCTMGLHASWWVRKSYLFDQVESARSAGQGSLDRTTQATGQHYRDGCYDQLGIGS